MLSRRPSGDRWRSLAAIDRDDPGDTIYAIDVVGEAVVTSFAETLAREHAFVLVAEGLAGGRRCYPEGRDEASVDWWIIVDPIDGTRGLMYQKRSGWVLTGVAPNRGPATSLRDVVLGVQTEIPLVKQHLSDQMWVGTRTKGTPTRSAVSAASVSRSWTTSMWSETNPIGATHDGDPRRWRRAPRCGR